MSLTCHSIKNEEEPKSTNQISKDIYEDEELDYEEEVEPVKPSVLLKSENDEDGELVEDDDDAGEVGEIGEVDEADDDFAKQYKNVQKKDKDEGEIDSEDELEEGEVKEENAGKKPLLELPKELQENAYRANTYNRPTAIDNRSNPLLRRPILERKAYYGNPYWPNQSYNNRYLIQRTDRYNINQNIRPREPLLPNVPQQSSESAWERGLKQARELISRASKRRGEEDYDKRYTSGYKGECSPEKRRRHSSQNSSSEDEIERRHRLAFDAAPWNSHSNNQPLINRRPNVSNRSAETYRDPWRRSKSPSHLRNRKESGANTRYGELYKDKTSNASSLSSICSSDFSDSEKSNGRKLPYIRTNLNTNRMEDEDLLYHERATYSKSSRFDRIPKKSNAIPVHKTDDDRNSVKSFDSWSVSDSSGSYFENSDSASDDEAPRHLKRSSDSRLMSKNSNTGGARKKSPYVENKRNSKIDSKEAISKTVKHGYQSSEPSAKVPIKMTFMKKQKSLKKDTNINEQLNGGYVSEVEDNSDSRTSAKSNRYDKSDEEERISPRREQLLLKLKVVEEAIERKLGHTTKL